MARARGPTIDRLALAHPTVEASRALLGARLVRDDSTGRRVGRIVEVEAYIGEEDRASHARFGRTDRNAVMYGEPGVAYVYLVYGMYDCLNVVTEPEGRPAAVLIRAVEPLEGIEAMQEGRAQALARRRSLTAAARVAGDARIRRTPAWRLASGPGLVGAAYGLDRSWTGVDLCDPVSPLRLEQASTRLAPADLVSSSRVGIDYAGEPWTSVPWRFSVRGHRSVSRPMPIGHDGA